MRFQRARGAQLGEVGKLIAQYPEVGKLIGNP
jgi:hypothetical protein